MAIAHGRPDNRPRHHFAFLTFNYDILLEVALTWAKLPFNYRLPSEPEDEGIPLLKLHGSVNWTRCPDCQDIVALSIPHYLPTVRAHGAQSVVLPLEAALKTNTHSSLWDREGRLLDSPCCTRLVLPPFIVPPTWDKGQHHRGLQSVWKAAAEELSSAEQLVVVGYSLPETDAFFRYLFALGLDNHMPLEQIKVIDPTAKEGGDVRRRFGHFLGHGIEKRIQYIPGTFEHTIGLVEALVKHAI